MKWKRGDKGFEETRSHTDDIQESSCNIEFESYIKSFKKHISIS